MAKSKKQKRAELPAHSKYGPSKAHRWLYCHASVAEESKYESTSSKYAVEGSCAHRLAELCLTDAVAYAINGGKKPKHAKRVGMTCDETGLEYDDEMLDAVLEYIDVVMDEFDVGKDEILIEKKLHTPEIHEQLFGTSDCIIVKPKKVVTVDFKYGKGVVVGAEDNEQMLTYTLMAALDVGDVYKKFKQIIVQPRIDDHERRVTSWEYDRRHLNLFRKRMEDALVITEKVRALHEAGKKIPAKYYAPGEKRCHFCKASGNCAAQDKYNLIAMQQNFDFIDEDTEFEPIAIKDLSVDRIAFVLRHRKAITEWMNAVQAHAINELQRDSRAVPEFKIVHGRSNRRWRQSFKDNPRRLIKRLLKALPSLDKADLINTQLRTVRQIESLIKGDDDALETFNKFWEKPPGKITLVSVDDGRKGISSLDDYE